MIKRILDEMYLRKICRRIRRRMHELKEKGEKITPEEQNYYVVYMYYMCMENGGLRRFYTGAFQKLVPYAEMCLGFVGAREHKIIYNEFIEANHIDVYDLSLYDQATEEDWKIMMDTHHFDEYDVIYESLTPLPKILKAYVKRHKDSFKKNSK